MHSPEVLFRQPENRGTQRRTYLCGANKDNLHQKYPKKLPVSHGLSCSSLSRTARTGKNVFLFLGWVGLTDPDKKKSPDWIRFYQLNRQRYHRHQSLMHIHDLLSYRKWLAEFTDCARTDWEGLLWVQRANGKWKIIAGDLNGLWFIGLGFNCSSFMLFIYNGCLD